LIHFPSRKSCIMSGSIDTKLPTPPSVRLFQARPPLDPVSFFQELAVKSVELGVTKQDIYGDFNLAPEISSLRQFEAEVAAYLGKEDALFVPSGIMAQNIVLAISKKQSKSSRFVCHWSSHLLIHEHNAYEELLNMTADIIPPEELFEVQSPVSFANISQFIQPTAAASHAAVILECPHREIGGKCTSITDIQQISFLCHQPMFIFIWMELDCGKHLLTTHRPLIFILSPVILILSMSPFTKA
jgi:hypothetical protein